MIPTRVSFSIERRVFVGRCVLQDLDLGNPGHLVVYWKKTDNLVKRKKSHAVPVVAS